MKTFTKYLIALIIVSSSTAFCEEEKRIEPGSRHFIEEQTQNYEDRQNTFVCKKQISEFCDCQYPPLVFDQHLHNLTGISVQGDYLIIEDGSQWNIKIGYASEVLTWKTTDPIALVKNDSYISSYFFGYKYKMINVSTNASVEVKLSLGPILTNPYTLLISSINPVTYEVLLSDNSLWQCDPSQYYLFDKWLPGDGIIVGTNVKGWFFNKSYDNILINVNLLQEIKANKVE